MELASQPKSEQTEMETEQTRGQSIHSANSPAFFRDSSTD